MQRTFGTILIVCLWLAGCGEEPGVRSYEVVQPAAYVWPETEVREDVHNDGLLDWRWEVPAGWADAPEVSDINLADYRFPGSSESLPGRMTIAISGGGLEANVARWRQQIRLGGIGQRDLVSDPLPLPDGEARIVELSGPYQGPHVPTHLLGAVVTIPAQGGGMYSEWYFKMVGDTETIDANRLAFGQLIQSFGLAARPMLEPRDDAPAGDAQAEETEPDAQEPTP